MAIFNLAGEPGKRNFYLASLARTNFVGLSHIAPNEVMIYFNRIGSHKGH